MDYQIKSFGNVAGVEYDEIVITNKQSMISFSNLGARVNRWIDKTGDQPEDIILGHDSAENAFIQEGLYYGATIGRVAGRIGEGRFEIDGTNYSLPINNNTHHLHGGPNSFDLRRWDYTVIESENKIAVQFELMSPDGDNGYPGELFMRVTHTYTKDNEWCIDYWAETDQVTLYNPTNHVYFNLNGNNRRNILNHYLWASVAHYVPINQDVTPVGTIKSVEGTVFNLRKGVYMQDIIHSGHPEIQSQNGLDHPFVFEENLKVLEISLPEKNRKVKMTTDRDCVVIYTSNSVPDYNVWGNRLVPYAGLTVETQSLPDAINQENFGNIILRPDQTFRSRTAYHLLIE